jgi:hypothetical protein
MVQSGKADAVDFANLLLARRRHKGQVDAVPIAAVVATGAVAPAEAAAAAAATKTATETAPQVCEYGQSWFYL